MQCSRQTAKRRKVEGTMRRDGQASTGYELIPRPASSFRISASVSIFFSCVASSRSPFCCFSFNSSMALSYVNYGSAICCNANGKQ